MKKKNPNIEEIKRHFAAMDPVEYDRLRQNYYKAAEGLRELCDALENLDADVLSTLNDPSATCGSEALLNEVLLVSDACDKLNRTILGQVL